MTRGQRAIVLLASVPAVRGGGGPWGNVNDEDSFYLWLLAAMVAITIVYDYVLHRFTHWLEHLAEAHDHHHKDNPFAEFALDPAKLWFQIWQRFQGELVALGCLAFTVWTLNYSGVFLLIGDALQDYEGSSSRSASGSGSGSGGSSGSGSSGSGSSGSGSSGSGSGGSGSSDRRELATASRFEADSCPRRLPTDGLTILHAAERIHFVLFIATTFYFFMVATSFYMYKMRLQRYSQMELEEAKIRLRGGDPEAELLKPEGTSWSARYKVWRRSMTLHRLRAMREYLMDYDELQDEFEEASAGGTEGGGGKPVLSVRAFIQRTSRHNIGALIAFPLTTWGTILIATVVLALVSRFGCLTMFEVNIMVTGYFYLSSVYIILRILIFRLQLKRRLRLPSSERKRDGEDAWPLPMFDRLFFWAVSGVSGYLPHEAHPSESRSLYLIQASLWFQCYFWSLLITEQATYEDSTYISTEGGWLRLASALAVLVWSFLILPEMLELYALPPYLDEHEQKFVLEVLQRFPEGFCPEDKDIFATRDGSSKVWKPLLRKGATAGRGLVRSATRSFTRASSRSSFGDGPKPERTRAFTLKRAFCLRRNLSGIAGIRSRVAPSPKHGAAISVE